jgi:hypothetical protein
MRLLLHGWRVQLLNSKAKNGLGENSALFAELTSHGGHKLPPDLAAFKRQSRYCEDITHVWVSECFRTLTAATL